MVRARAAVESADPRGDLRRRGALAVTRRVALVLPALVVAACTSPRDTAADSTTPNANASNAPSVTNERELIAKYDSVIAQFPQLAASLTPIRDQHRAHLTALGGSLPAPASEGSQSEARSPQAATTYLAEAEKAAAQQRLADCLAAAEESLARTLASIAASEASHVAQLVGM